MSNDARDRAPVDPEARRNFVILLIIATVVMVAIVGGTIVFLGN